MLKGSVFLFIGISSISVSGGLLNYAYEGMRMNLECKANSSIKITSAVYSSVDNPKCNSSILARVSSICNNKKTCEVIVSSKYFKDPCPGEYKRAVIVYQCLKKEIPREKKSYADEGMKMTLLCEAEQKIKIQFGRYGHFSDKTGCEKGRTDCFAIITRQVTNRCDTKHKCDVIASNKYFGDPCPGIEKRAVVYFTCH